MALLNLKKTKHDARKRRLIGLLIGMERLNIIVHCCLYYHLDSPILSDAEYDKTARELCKLQEDYPELAAEAHFHEFFEEFKTGCVTGLGLPYTDPAIIEQALYLLQNKDKK